MVTKNYLAPPKSVKSALNEGVGGPGSQQQPGSTRDVLLSSRARCQFTSLAAASLMSVPVLHC